MPETLDKSTFGSLDKNHVFNLERSLTLNTLIGGHLVQGHVDTTARVSSIKNEVESKVLKFEIDKKITKYMVYKGSITVNGVSLTIVSVDSSHFTVSLIPYTLSHTNLSSLKVGDSVNIEVDMMAKYVEKLSKK